MPQTTPHASKISFKLLSFVFASVVIILSALSYSDYIFIMSIQTSAMEEKTILVNKLISSQIDVKGLLPYIDALKGDEEFKKRQVEFSEAKRRLFEIQNEKGYNKRNSETIRLQRTLQEVIDQFRAEIAGFKDENYRRIQEWINELRLMSGAKYLYVVADTGVDGFFSYLFDAHTADESLDLDRDDIGSVAPHEDFPYSEIVYATGRQVAYAEYYEHDIYGTLYSSYSPLLNDEGEIVAFTGTDFDISELMKNIARLRRRTIESLLVVVGLFMAILFLIMRRLVIQPIDALTETADNIFRGEVSAEIPAWLLQKSDEMGSLSRALDAVTRTFRDMLSSTKQTLEAVISGHLDARNDPDAFKGDIATVVRQINETFDIMATYFEKAQSASKAKGEFLSRVSHELRSPMNVIIGMARLGLKPSDVAPDAAMRFKNILSASTHLLGIINDVLDMSRIESGKIDIRYAQFNIRDVVLDCYNLLKPQTEERGLLFEHSIAPDVVLDVIGDADRIRQVIINLLTNSSKFTEAGGKLILTVSSVSTPDAEGPSDNLFIAFSVEDTGVGMSEEFLRKIFNPFEQEEQYLQRKYKGTGLGLSICHRLVELMGGTIEVTSKLSVGSKFTFTLPLMRGAAPETENGMAKEVVEADFSNIRLLLVDDIELNRMIMTESLADTKIQIVEASDGDEAVQVFAKSKEGEFNIIFMDVQMPKMDGYQATEAIRALARSDAKTVPIIAMTANAMQEDVEQALAHGMTRHIAKPIDIDECISAIMAMGETVPTGEM
ncbi:hypothetical protein FACS1894204_05200 [Synergistales bacterium]|nr:hypothetical protein FACS1894204_05200 [Synergistales bacterium]